ncbi:MAG: amidohydrolase family protein [Planctomycetaceae bacterium]|nr:amidohydrolase family protein [Planctomycetaceae bacterium]
MFHARQGRRRFLQTISLAATAPSWLSAAESKPPPIVDTHTHFYDPSRPQGVPWPGKNDPFLYRTVLPAEYRGFAAPLGVVGTVVVEASPWVEDNQWVLDLADQDPFVLGLVGNLPPGTDDFRKHYNRFAKHPKFRGIRVNAGPLAEGLPKPEFLADIRRLQETDRELDINGGPSLLPLVDQLATTLPDLRIVINHLANVRIDGATIPADYLRDLKAAAAHPQVFMKVSALVEGASQGTRKAPGDPEYYRPILNAVWEVFGEDRVIYGSNWPVSARFADYKTVQTIVQAFVSDKSPAAQAKFFRGNALAAYRWEG